ncbi:PssD/Cps14F family polysaccharide biosynthesis glycosyltransferase [Aquimarina algicola]|uniref:Polysaccharide biosynthesis protein n=1 Tax=Aquimarina algicola TaxID=2589995 RepID=A0A504JAG8_9FLAO|nr:PssD/Cps14F family polysaccharide biosynthesis glycosyltransferase [Aquimarina algicola]TPN87887.1 polysaccharide biosynthesis protein [Aquimarina algicola]
MKKVLFISSLGGHLEQLLSLQKVINNYDSYIVTERNSSTEKLQKNYKNINYLPYISRKNIILFLINYLKCTLLSIVFFLRIKPNIIVTTGAGCVIPMCLLAKVFGKKVIFIETFSRIDSKTLTGKVCYYFADVFIVQWEDLKKIYPKSIFFGSIY